MYYKPDPNSAYESIKHITNDVTLGWLVRGMHRWGASLFIILMFFHMARVFLFGAYKYPRELNWIIGVLLLVLGMLEGFTGYLLPWDQTAYWATVVGINLNGTGPIVGPFLSSVLRGGAEIGPRHARALLLDPHADHPGRDLRADRAAPLPRDPPRRHLAAVVEDGRRCAVDRGGGARRRAARRRLVQPGSAERGRNELARRTPRRSSRSTRRTSRRAGSRSSRTRCSTTR